MCNTSNFNDLLVDLCFMLIFHHTPFQPSYQLAITTEGMIPDIVGHLSSDDLELKMQCSRAIFKCANDKVCSFPSQ